MFFIFGSSGFIGSKLKERLIEKFGSKKVFLSEENIRIKQ